MKFTFQWLKDYVDFHFTPQELAERLTMLGLEIEGTKTVQYDIDGLKVGKLVEQQSVHTYLVDLGSDVLSVFYPQNGLPLDQKVAIGTSEKWLHKIPEKVRRQGGVEGFIPSAVELGLAETASPVLLDQEAILGTQLNDYFPETDVVFEVDLTPNRPDCLGIIGIAREISTITGNPIRPPQVRLTEAKELTADFIQVKIENPKGCPRYSARIIKGVQIKPSPCWLQNRLSLAGIRPINNVVDVTNYVMLEFGHPLHAFDFDLLAQGKIVVRCSKAGEHFVTLDGKSYSLNNEIVLICDGEQPVALAGIMGGMNTEVRNETSNVLLECAYFDPTSIRKSRRFLGIDTESSMRFERGVDPNATLTVINRAAELIQKTAGGKILQGVVDSYPQKYFPITIELRPTYVSKLLGKSIPAREISTILSRLGMEVQDNKQALRVTVPTFRPDLTREVDLIEEIARVHGYNNFVEKETSVISLHFPLNKKDKFVSTVREIMVGQGFKEILTNSMISSNDEWLSVNPDDKSLIRLKNPLSEDMAILRPSLLPGVLRVAQRNLFRQISDFRLFEIGITFERLPDQPERGKEILRLAGLLTGLAQKYHWLHKGRPVDFYDAKGTVAFLLHQLNFSDVRFEPFQNWFIQEPGATVLLTNLPIGVIGKLRKNLQEKYDVNQDIFIFELNLDVIFENLLEERVYRPIPKFPVVRRDLALVVDESLPGERLVGVIKKWGGTYLREVEIFDIYWGKQIQANKKSIAVSLQFQSEKHTLTEQEINEIMQTILLKLKEELNAELRSS